MLKFYPKDLEYLLDRVSYAVSQETFRPGLYKRILVSQTATGFTLTACDGHRTAHLEVDGDFFVEAPNRFQADFPLEVVRALMDNLSDISPIRIDSAPIDDTSNRLTVTVKGVSFSWAYDTPALQDCLRFLTLSGSTALAELTRKEMFRWAKNVKKQYKEQGLSKSLPLAIFRAEKDGKFAVSCGLNQNADVQLEHAKISGDYILKDDIGFNAAYLEQAFRKSLKEDEIEAQLRGPLDPSIWKTRTKFKGDHMTVTCVIMPMRI
jgi:DNA polymerase III sliding clamp (beta) subunit (PCNA family)